MNRVQQDDVKVGWRVSEWAHAVGISRASVFNLLSDGAIRSVKSRNARIIVTSPRDYLNALAEDAA
jgi:predicted site-specific integrase-resolvase